jgi:sugar O-acyltransferase (sialic acid O-acetyltransferase NeuD family)
MTAALMKKLYIVGAGSVGLHVAANFVAYSTGQYQLSGFFDDDISKHGKKYYGAEVLGSVNNVLKLKDAAIVIGIAFPKIKKTLTEHLLVNQNIIYPSLVHPSAWLSPDVQPGRGTIIYPGTSINYGSQIGEFCVFNMNCALGHHTKVGNYSSFAPGVLTGGHTTIKECVDMGIGSATLQDVMIGNAAIVGGQSLIRENVASNTVVVGVPAKTIKTV